MATTTQPQIATIVDWLADGARSAIRPARLLDELCQRATAAGLPLWRVAIFVRTLHPGVMGNRFLWQEGREVQVLDAPFETLQSPVYVDSPVAHVYRTGESIRISPHSNDASPRYAVVEELRAEGASDYFVTPLVFTSGERHVASWTTRRPGGFTPGEIEAIEAMVPALTRVTEIRTLRRTAVNLLDTYVGHQSGERVLSGQIRRGHGETVRGAVWMSDMHGFTAFSDRLQPQALLDLLNSYFDCQVPAITAQGGEVLKFIGDGLLAIFPELDGDLPAACRAAAAAARDACRRLAGFNAELASGGGLPLRCGIALHAGEFLYGNIGGGNRLDFTCIGPAINLTARLERLTRRFPHAVVASHDFVTAGPDFVVAARDSAAATREPVVTKRDTGGRAAADFAYLGEVTLAGIEAPQPVYGMLAPGGG